MILDSGLMRLSRTRYFSTSYCLRYLSGKYCSSGTQVPVGEQDQTKKLARDSGERLASSSRIRLQSFPGMALAHESRVQVLVLDSILGQYCLREGCPNIGESDEEPESDHYSTTSDEDESDEEEDRNLDDESKFLLKKGAGVKYLGPTIKANNRTISELDSFPHLFSGILPPVEGGPLLVPIFSRIPEVINVWSLLISIYISSLKNRMLRLMGQEEEPKEQEKEPKGQEKEPKGHLDILKSLATNKYERALVSEVVLPDEIGVKFEDVGALVYVKDVLNEVVIFPMTRPDLFSHGDLRRPCQGILLYGPPGTGKTLIAKALATESNANFFSISSASLASKWVGDSEKYAKALFTLARKLEPVIIFIDEIDSLLHARGRHYESESSRSLQNEFMSAWDGFRSKASQRIVVLGATNRPFDIDEAVIRRMPRRILVDLPDSENRMKILKVILAKEVLESGFCFETIAKATEGYSASDLKHLCAAAAYVAIQEVIQEMKVNKSYEVSSFRPIKLDDFIRSISKVRPSVSATSLLELRQWSEKYGDAGGCEA